MTKHCSWKNALGVDIAKKQQYLGFCWKKNGKKRASEDMVVWATKCIWTITV